MDCGPNPFTSAIMLILLLAFYRSPGRLTLVDGRFWRVVPP